LTPARPIVAGGQKKLGATIDGYRFEFPCKGILPDNPKPGADCESGLVTGDPKKTDNFTAVRKFDGGCTLSKPHDGPEDIPTRRKDGTFLYLVPTAKFIVKRDLPCRRKGVVFFRRSAAWLSTTCYVLGHEREKGRDALTAARACHRAFGERGSHRPAPSLREVAGIALRVVVKASGQPPVEH
jgi:hypothetical protein